MANIYNELKTEFTKCPILLSGDFNGHAAQTNTESEFSDIYLKTDLIDILELAQIPTADRATFIQIKSGQRADGRQIDFCFIPKSQNNYI